jgi:hypothetical protein
MMESKALHFEVGQAGIEQGHDGAGMGCEGTGTVFLAASACSLEGRAEGNLTAEWVFFACLPLCLGREQAC